MNSVERELAGMRAAHARLVADLGTLTDTEARRPSLLPDWSVGHVVTHIARNADGFTLMLTAAAAGEVGSQYPGGVPQRNADIEAGSGRSAAELVADVVASNARLEVAFHAMTTATWSAVGNAVMGPVPMDELPYRRWRETIVHHADCGLAYSWRDWPADYVRQELPRMVMLWSSRKPMGMTVLPPAALAVPDQERLAWLMGRTVVAGLEPAGIF